MFISNLCKPILYILYILHNRHGQLFGVHFRVFFLNSSEDLIRLPGKVLKEKVFFIILDTKLFF